MAAITSDIDASGSAFRQNRRAMLDAMAGVRALEAKVHAASNGKRDQFARRGQLVPRDRVSLLLDPETPFLELSTLAGLGMHDDDGDNSVLGAGIITGIGTVSGVRCVVIASDSAIKGGTSTPMGMRKRVRALDIARLNQLPVVHLVESGGANLNYQALSFVEAGESYCKQARLSAAGIPQISLVHGSSTAGGAYLPGLSDYIVMVKGRAKVFLAGPPLLRAATGEIAQDEELGGAEMHATLSGVCDYLAEDDADAIRIGRDIVAKLGWPTPVSRPHRPPLYAPDELAGVVPFDFRTQYDVREVIARVVDGSDLLEFKSSFGPHTVCGQAEIAGYACAIIGNNGPIDSDGAAKAAQFIQLMCQIGTPILYLQNTTGFMVGTDAEHRGIIKHGSKMIQAVANASVPQITLHIGASFGAGNYGMCGRGFGPRFVFAWPNNRVAVMGGEQAAKVLSIISEQRAARSGQPVDAADLAARERKIVAQFERESEALFATARLWDDGIIDPRDTRNVLALCLSICSAATSRQLRPSSFGVARM